MIRGRCKGQKRVEGRRMVDVTVADILQSVDPDERVHLARKRSSVPTIPPLRPTILILVLPRVPG